MAVFALLAVATTVLLLALMRNSADDLSQSAPAGDDSIEGIIEASDGLYRRADLDLRLWGDEVEGEADVPTGLELANGDSGEPIEIWLDNPDEVLANEGDHMVFHVRLSRPAPAPISVFYRTEHYLTSSYGFEELTEANPGMALVETGDDAGELEVATELDLVFDNDRRFKVFLISASANGVEVKVTGRGEVGLILNLPFVRT